VTSPKASLLKIKTFDEPYRHFGYPNSNVHVTKNIKNGGLSIGWYINVTH